MTTRSGEYLSSGIKYKVNFEIECDINQLDPIVTRNDFEQNEVNYFLNIYIKSKYGNNC